MATFFRSNFTENGKKHSYRLASLRNFNKMSSWRYVNKIDGKMVRDIILIRALKNKMFREEQKRSSCNCQSTSGHRVESSTKHPWLGHLLLKGNNRPASSSNALSYLEEAISRELRQ